MRIPVRARRQVPIEPLVRTDNVSNQVCVTDRSTDQSFTDVELIHELEPVVETGVGSVYDLRQPLDDVVMPLLRK